MKAKLEGRQVLAALIAGIVGNLLFSSGWTALGLILLGGGAFALFGGSLSVLFGQFTDPTTLAGLFDGAGGIIAGVVIGASIAALVLMLLGFLVSGWILKGGRARKPWRVTWLSTLITAILMVPLLFLWFGIANGTDGLPVGAIIAIGTAAVGAVVWLWMTWAHRGPASPAP
ncbi:MAG: hypothetical protein ABL886_10445 [Rhodoglobus sp.]